jgi:hypothetical protein
MKPLVFALLASVALCAAAAASPPGERSPEAVAIDADRMDYRPLGVPAQAKAGGSLKPALDDAVFHPITVEVHAEVRSDGSVHLVCDGGAGHDHDAHGHHHDDHADAEPQQ